MLIDPAPQQWVVVAPTVQSFEAAHRFRSAHDTRQLGELAQSGAIKLADPGAAALILEANEARYRVRLIDGTKTGFEGYVHVSAIGIASRFPDAPLPSSIPGLAADDFSSFSQEDFLKIGPKSSIAVSRERERASFSAMGMV